MIEQISFDDFGKETKDAKDILLDIILEISRKWHCSADLFRIENNKTNNKTNGYSLYLEKSLILKSDLLFNSISAYKSYINRSEIPYKTAKELKSPNGFIKCTYNNPCDLKKATLFVVDKFVEEYEPADHFGCCSQYVECSDANRCLHKDFIRSKSCYYKKNLESGRIFYGKNANI